MGVFGLWNWIDLSDRPPLLPQLPGMCRSPLFLHFFGIGFGMAFSLLLDHFVPLFGAIWRLKTIQKSIKNPYGVRSCFFTCFS